MFCLSAQPTLFSSQDYELSFRQASSASNEKLLENVVVLMQKSKNFTKKSFILKFIYFEKATKFYEISTVDLTVTTQDKSKVEISQNFVAFSE